MKTEKRFSVTGRILAVVIAALSLFSVSSVFATWKYTYETVTPQAKNFNVKISEFTWDSEEVLPSDKPGENHLSLMDDILNNVKVGLNASKDTLENAVNSYQTLYSFQSIQGGNLKHLFTTSGSAQLDFVIQYVNDNQYYLYTFEDDDLSAGAINVTQIVVYRTELKKTAGTWDTVGSTIGHSLVRLHSPENLRTVNPTEWEAGHVL